MMDGFFQTVSAISTTGFAISDNNTWPMFASIVLVLISVPCGMAGSTTGGVKSDRMLLMFKTIGQQIKSSIHPSSINQVHIGNHILSNDDIYPHIVYIGLYFMTIAVSVALTIMSGMGVGDSVATSITCLSNVGPALGEMGTLGNFNTVPIFSKVIFIFDMFLGRVEIYPVLAVIMMALSKKTR